MKKAFFVIIALVCTPLIMCMDQQQRSTDITLELFPNPDAGTIIGIDSTLLPRLNQAQTESDPLFDQDFSALENTLTQSRKDDPGTQLLTKVNTCGYAYITISGETDDIKNLAQNPYVKLYVPYSSPEVKHKWIAQRLKQEHRYAKTVGFRIGYLAGSAVCVTLGCAVLIIAALANHSS